MTLPFTIHEGERNFYIFNVDGLVASIQLEGFIEETYGEMNMGFFSSVFTSLRRQDPNEFHFATQKLDSYSLGPDFFYPSGILSNYSIFNPFLLEFIPKDNQIKFLPIEIDFRENHYYSLSSGSVLNENTIMFGGYYYEADENAAIIQIFSINAENFSAILNQQPFWVKYILPSIFLLLIT